MNPIAEVERRLERGQPFRAAVPLEDLTWFLVQLAERRPSPSFVIRRAEPGADAIIDFAGCDGTWILRHRPALSHAEQVAKAS